ncbi:hypothetical protein [Methylobacterium oryzisoli]|uniref:hypothetical protein n=1 Tax=Methylobacterium oryzisoli TaxID=3385502 RepID=UPI003891C52D
MSLRVVADTGPLNDLLLIGLIDLLPRLFDALLNRHRAETGAAGSGRPRNPGA